MNELTKTCCVCKVEKLLDNFSKNKKSKDGKQSKCKLCESELNRKFRSSNPNYMKDHFQCNKEYYNELHRNWNENNREHLNSYHSNYRNVNLEKIQQYQNNWAKNKYNTDINYKLKIILKTRIIHGLKRSLNRGEKIVKYLGCSFVDYKLYLDSLLKPEMNWFNHGEVWEIDHILPISSFDLNVEENINTCFHYSNTQPLFKTSEISKGFGYDEIGNRNKKDKICFG